MIFVANIIISLIWLPIGLLIQIAAMVRFFSIVIVAKTIEAISGKHNFNISDEASAEITDIWSNGFRIIWSKTRQISDKEKFYNTLAENIIVTFIVWVPIILLIANLTNSFGWSQNGESSDQTKNSGNTHYINLEDGTEISFSAVRSCGFFCTEDYIETNLLRQIEIGFGFWGTTVILRVCNFEKKFARTPQRIQLIDANGNMSRYAYESGAKRLSKDECANIELEEFGNDFATPMRPLTGKVRIGQTEIRI